MTSCSARTSSGRGPVEYRRVTALIRRHAKEVLRLTLRGIRQAETLGVTKTHPFWRAGNGWTRAGKLQPGDRVWSLERGWLRVVRAHLERRPQRVYNLEVDEDHTYTVGRLAAWVHNDKSCSGAGGHVPNDAVICRGGTCTAERFRTGSGVTLDSEGNLQNVSVNQGKTLEEAAKGIKNKQVGVTTAGKIREAGGEVRASPGSNPNHCTMCSISPEKAEELFTPTVQNPHN